MSQPEEKLLGACGLYCGACNNYLAFQPQNSHLLTTAKFAIENPQRLACRGCHSEQLTEHCARCAMRNCANGKGLRFCGECAEYPCETIGKFHADGFVLEGATHRTDILDNTVRLQSVGPTQWLIDQASRWTCTCGLAYSYYESVCARCGESLPSYAAIERQTNKDAS